MKHREASVLSGALTCRQKRSVIEVDVSLDMWLGEYMEAVQVQFGPRVWFIGLQGSFGRGEATAESDLDVVLILDAVSAADLRAYSAMLDRLPERERVCGFVSGKGELLAWEPADLFQFAMIPGPSWGPWIRCWRKSRRGTSTGRSGQGLAMCTTCAPTIWSMKKAWTFCGTCINLLDLPSRPLPTCKRGNMPGRNRSCASCCSRRTGTFWRWAWS